MARKRRRSITSEDLLRIIRVGDPRLAPDGQRVLFTTRTFGERNDQPTQLWLADTEGDRVRRLTAGERDRGGRFAPDGGAVFFVREREKGEPQLAVVALDGGEAEELTELPAGSIGAMEVSPAGTHLAFTWRQTDPERTKAAEEARKESGATDPPMIVEDPWYRLDGDGYFGTIRWELRVLDLATREIRVIDDRDNAWGYDFDFSPDGKRIVYTTNRVKRAMLRPNEQQLRIANIAKGTSRKLDWIPRGPKMSPRWSPDGSKLAYAGREGADDAYSPENLELCVADLSKRTTRSLTAKTDYCMMAYVLGDTAEVGFDAQILWTRNSKRILTRIGWFGEGRIMSFGVGRTREATLLEGHADANMGDLDAKGEQICFLQSTPTQLPEVFVASLDGRDELTPRRLTHFNDELLSELTLSKPREHSVKAEDGTKIQTWVLRPPGIKADKRTPGILQVHGGPHGLYGWTFFHEFQVLAAQGWTVVYSNPRGSKGYGQDHCIAIRGSWGEADWHDVQAVTQFMKKHKGIKPSRIGIMGGSYGGYMTNWAVSHSNEYVAGITDRCVSNLLSMTGSSDFIWPPDEYWTGAPWDRPEEIWEASPIKHFKGVKTPLLIIHSEGDLRCNIEQSEQIHAALAVQNVPCRFVRYPRSTSHGMSRSGPPDMRLHRLGEIVAWWKTYF